MPASLRLNLPLEKGETVVVEARVVSVDQWHGEPAWDLRFERVPPPIQQKIVQFVTARAAVDRSAGGIDPRVPEPKARDPRAWERDRQHQRKREQQRERELERAREQEREQDRQRRQGAQTRPATPRRASSGTLLGAAITPDQPLPAVQSASTKQPASTRQPTPRLLPAVVEQAPRPTGAAFPSVARDDDDGDKRPPRGAVSLSPSRRRRRS